MVRARRRAGVSVPGVSSDVNDPAGGPPVGEILNGAGNTSEVNPAGHERPEDALVGQTRELGLAGGYGR